MLAIYGLLAVLPQLFPAMSLLAGYAIGVYSFPGTQKPRTCSLRAHAYARIRAILLLVPLLVLLGAQLMLYTFASASLPAPLPLTLLFLNSLFIGRALACLGARPPNDRHDVKQPCCETSVLWKLPR